LYGKSEGNEHERRLVCVGHAGYAKHGKSTVYG
jgi:GTPase